MEHTPAGKLEWSPGSPDTFTGRVSTSPMSGGPDRTIAALGVMFEPGARTYWHSHPDGQVLYVASGAGRIGSAEGSVEEMAVGDVIYTAPGERHWHGASPTSYMMHISLTSGGATEWEPQAVTAEEYGAEH